MSETGGPRHPPQILRTTRFPTHSVKNFKMHGKAHRLFGGSISYGDNTAPPSSDAEMRKVGHRAHPKTLTK